ncbi:MAG: DMT family transporter [Planctomycetota bacterium]
MTSSRPAPVALPTRFPPADADPNAPSRAAWFALIAVQILFATFPVAGKIAFEGMLPMTVAMWRVAVGAPVFLLLAWRRWGRGVMLPVRDLAFIFWLSLLGITFNQVLFIRGLSLSTATNAGLLMPIIPSATYGFALLLGRESFRLRRVGGLVAATAGIAALFLERGADVGGDTWRGDLMMVGNTFCYALYIVQAKPLLARVPPLVFTFWVFFFGALCIPALAGDAPFVPESASPRSWLALLWIVAFPSIIAYLLNLYALKRIEASIVGVFVCLQPLVSLAGAHLVLGEPLRPIIFVTAPLVLLGVWLVTGARLSTLLRRLRGPK